jgi:hypothetical protein
MATLKKAQKGKSIEPTYKGLKWGYDTPTKKDSLDYKKGFYEGVEAKRKKRQNTANAFGTSATVRGFNEGYKKQRNGGSTPAWQRKEGKNPEGGLNAKGVASYRRANPGSKLKTAVTTKPSKLKAGSKDAKRRKSFCARMSGVEGPMKKPNGKPTRKALALRKWNC